MPRYRLYFINPAPRHIRDVVDFDAPDDRAARREAAKLFDARAAELWQADRLVEAFDPKERAP